MKRPIDEFIEKHPVFRNAEPAGSWNGYEVYEVMKKRDVRGKKIGLPVLILAKGDDVHRAKGNELIKCLGSRTYGR